jgi:hypothetical protein
MISYAPLDEIIKRPSQPIIQQVTKPKKVEDDELVESECYYVTIVFMLILIVLLTTDMIKK